MSYDNREAEVNKIIDAETKKWNTHMLRVCTKTLTELSKKDFKLRRRCTYYGDSKKECICMQQMLVDKAKLCNENQWGHMYKRLLEFESKRHLHPRRKIIDY